MLIINQYYTDQYQCPRDDIVAKLAELLEDKRIVLVRYTPASGKSALAYLLNRYCSQRGIRSVLIDIWPPPGEDRGIQFIIKCTHMKGYTDVSKDNIMDTKRILDEVQMSYDDPELWLSFTKFRHGRLWGPMICASATEAQAQESELRFGHSLGRARCAQRVSSTLSA